MSTASEQDVFNALAELVRQFEGREYSGPLTRDTLFFADLGFASIDAVVMGEKLEERFGCRFPYSAFLGELGSRGAEDVSFGELVDFVHRNLPRE